LSGGVHQATIEAIDAPEQDRFQIITEHPATGLIYSPTYLGRERRDDIRDRADHFVSRTQARAEAEIVSTHDRNIGQESWAAPAGSCDQSSGNCLGELVVRNGEAQPANLG
jgi:hypothetical protein